MEWRVFQRKDLETILIESYWVANILHDRNIGEAPILIGTLANRENRKQSIPTKDMKILSIK